MPTVNLIPAEIARSQALRIRLKRWGVVTGLAALLTALPCGVRWSRSVQAAGLASELSRIDEELAAARGALREASSKAQELNLEVQRAKALRSKRAWSGIFALTASAMPADCWLSSMATDPETPAIHSARAAAAGAAIKTAQPATVTIDAPRRMRLLGLSRSDLAPLDFVRNLKSSNAFARVTLEKSVRAENGEPGKEKALYQFEITCEW